MEEMGMTDLQFKDFLRGLVNDLERVRDKCDKSKEAEQEVEALIKRFKIALED